MPRNFAIPISAILTATSLLSGIAACNDSSNSWEEQCHEIIREHCIARVTCGLDDKVGRCLSEIQPTFYCEPDLPPEDLAPCVEKVKAAECGVPLDVICPAAIWKDPGMDESSPNE